MTAFPSYSTGTISIAAAATVVIGTGTIFNGTNARPGDLLLVAGNPVVVIEDTTDFTHLVIDAWPYAAVVNQPYKILQYSPLRFAGGQAMADVTRIVGTMNTDGFFVFVPDDESVPDPSLGDDGQYARKPTTGEEWLKDGGVWVSQGIFKPLGVAAPYDNAMVYSLNNVATLNGSSYIYINTTPSAGNAPPNAIFWTVLAAAGAKWYENASGPPGGQLQPGDFALNTTNGDIWENIAGTLTIVANLTGPQGIKGDTGDTATIAIGTVTTGSAGSTATVTNSGDAHAATFDFSIPQGVQGVQGVQGQSIQPDATGTAADKTSHDAEAKGFVFLETDTSPFQLWIKASATSGDWAGPTYATGNVPLGDLGSVTDMVEQSFDLGVLA